LLFVALRKAPAIEANLINYTWPILIILLSPLILPRNRLLAKHLIGGAMAFAGAGFAIGGTQARFQSEFIFGYSLALGAALIWALYSLLTKRLRPFPSAAVGGFCFASAILALICHFILEPTTNISVKDWGLILIIGVGPLGMAFYTWDAAIKLGDPKKIAALSYITPLLSTLILAASSQENSLTFSHLLAVLLIIAGAMLSQFSRAKI
jgi:drug/metabolite transporter (DMT)-like permease